MAKSLTQIVLFLLVIFFALDLHPSKAQGPECVKAKNPTLAKKPHMVLVHAFRGGGWVWYKARLTLEALGYTVTSIDLKGGGIDPTDPDTIDTLEQYNEPLDRFMSELPPGEKVGLVAHSSGGVSITKVLHDHPDKVQFAIYIVATMLKNGYATCEDLRIGVPHFNESKCSASCPKELPRPSCFEKTMSTAGLLVPSGEMEGYTLAMSLLRRGPLRAICTSKFVDKGLGVDKVPRIYVKTVNDQVLLPYQQDAMVKAWPPCEVHDISNDHDVPGDKPHMIVAYIVNATLSYGSS